MFPDNKISIIGIISILIILTLPLFLMGLSMELLLGFDPFYVSAFERHGVFDALAGYDVLEIHQEVMDYLRDPGKTSIDAGSFFNERETRHFSDVKRLLQLNRTIFYGLSAMYFILLLIFSLYRNFNKKNVFSLISVIFLYGSLLTLLLCILVLTLLFAGFESFFSSFHTALFPSGTYMFDPSTEMIVVLYPEAFFFESGVLWFLSVVAFACIILCFVYCINKFILRRKNLSFSRKNSVSSMKKRKL